MNEFKLMSVLILVFLSVLCLANPVIHLSECELQELKDKDNTLLIISSVNGKPYSSYSKTASIEDEVKLSVVLWKNIGNRFATYSEVENLIHKGFEHSNTKIKIQISGGEEGYMKMIPSLKALGNVSIKWYKIEEANGDDYNNPDPSWHWEDIPYKETEVVEWRNKFIVNADVTPTVFEPVYCNGKVVGTMRYKAVLTINDETFSTPDKESKHMNSISKAVHRISLKGNTNNEVINCALAMCNLPYIWGSASFTGDKYDNHQAELFIGADCADFCVAAHQMAGKQLPYDCIRYLSHTRIITKENSVKNGNYLDSDNNEIKVGNDGVQAGDFVYWGTAHVGLFFEDKSNPNGQYSGQADGIFNHWDLVLHTLEAEPKIERIMNIQDYGNLTVYRFEKKE